MSAPARRPAPPPPAHVAAVRDFVRGFVEPSRLGFLTLLAAFVAAACGAAWFFSPPVLSGSLGKYLARSASDAEAQATSRAMQLHAHPPDAPQLILLGSSALANAVASEPLLEREIEARTGQDWAVSVLTTPLQTTIDQIALIQESLGAAPGPRRPVVIAIESGLMREHVNVPHILELEAEGRLGVRSDWADAAVRKLGGTPRPRHGVYALDNYHFVILNGGKALTRLLVQTPARRSHDTYAPKTFLPAERRIRPQIYRSLRRGQSQPLVYGPIDDLATRLRAYPNVHLVFIESRMSPDFLRVWGLESEDTAAQARIRAAAAARGIEYWPIITQSQIPAAAYYDDLHIATAPEQARVRAALAGHVAHFAETRGLR